jgi:hypothetical protein
MSYKQGSILDDFNRANGSVGSNWIGNTSKFAIDNQQLKLTTTNDWGYLVWKNTYFGPEQEAYLTVTQIDAGSEAIDLFLKAQINIAGTIDVIDVWYDPSSHTVEIGTYDAVNGWFPWRKIMAITAWVSASSRLRMG